MFQCGSRASLPFPPPSVTTRRRGVTNRSAVNFRGNIQHTTPSSLRTAPSSHRTALSSHHTVSSSRRPAISAQTPQAGTLEEVLQRPDFGTWLARSQNQETAGSSSRGSPRQPPIQRTAQRTRTPMMPLVPTRTVGSISTESSISSRSSTSSDDSMYVSDPPSSGLPSVAREIIPPLTQVCSVKFE